MASSTALTGPRGSSHARSLQLRRLAAFLRSRREQVLPAAVAVPNGGGRRRARGLRREDVADIAQISVAWYTRLEQGQDVRPSLAVLGRVAAALRLGAAERTHLFRLAGVVDDSGPATAGDAAPVLRAVDVVPSPDAPDGTPPHLRRLLDGIQTPALLMDRYWDVVGRNAALEAMLGPLEPPRVGPNVPPRNVVRWVLSTRPAGAGGADWESLARVCVGGLRATLGQVWAEHPDDRRAATLVDLLTRESPEFRAWWPEQQVWAADRPLRRAYEHPRVGRLAVEITLLEVRSAPGVTLVTHVAGDAASAAKLRELALVPTAGAGPTARVW